MTRAALMALALIGCAPAAVADAPAARAGDPFVACDGGRADALLGRRVDAKLRAAAQRRVGAATTRVVAPGAATTMDYRGDRLNIETDAAGRATRFHCG